jgi:hypothetical protein
MREGGKGGRRGERERERERFDFVIMKLTIISLHELQHAFK